MRDSIVSTVWWCTVRSTFEYIEYWLIDASRKSVHMVPPSSLFVIICLGSPWNTFIGRVWWGWKDVQILTEFFCHMPFLPKLPPSDATVSRNVCEMISEIGNSAATVKKSYYVIVLWPHSNGWRGIAKKKLFSLDRITAAGTWHRLKDKN